MVRPGTVVYRTEHPTLGGIVIRYPKPGDLEVLRKYANKISKERTFLTLQGQTLSLAEERKFLNSSLQKVSKGDGVHLMSFQGRKLCGHADLHRAGTASEKHVADFGISIDRDFRGLGLGKMLMGLVLGEAKKRIKGLEIVKLGVFGNNKVAERMYRKFGFKRYGVLPRGALHAGKHVDHVFMYKNMK